jgi:hypothetical protein
VGTYTVIVGRVTLVIAVTGNPPIKSFVFLVSVSGPGTGFKSGAVPGHIGTCTCPAEGCHCIVFACALAHASSSPRATAHRFMTLSIVALGQGGSFKTGKSGETALAHPACGIGLAAASLVTFS